MFQNVRCMSVPGVEGVQTNAASVTRVELSSSRLAVNEICRRALEGSRRQCRSRYLGIVDLARFCDSRRDVVESDRDRNQ